MKFKNYLNEKTEKISVVSFKPNKKDVKFDKALKKRKAKVTDWYEKDYGTLLDIDIPSDEIRGFKRDIENLKDFQFEGD